MLANATEIVSLARSRDQADRGRLLTSVVELCAQDPEACRSPATQAVLSEVFLALVSRAESDIRRRLSERLSTVAWAPPPLISVLALDDIEIARPVIANSPILKDHDLVRLLVEATLEHQMEVARRPGIGSTVVAAILDQGQPSVLTALAGNDTADVSPLAMQRLVMASRRIAGLRGALAQHPRLTADLAQALYGWVGDALRASLEARYDLDPELLRRTVEAVAAEAVEDPFEPSPADADRERELMERRLVDKLNAADQLRPTYLLRTLREGRLLRFQAALCALGGYPPGSVKAALSADTSDRLALACAGVGIDRSVFPTILSLVRPLNAGRPLPLSDANQALRGFNRSQAEAAAAFRQDQAAI